MQSDVEIKAFHNPAYRAIEIWMWTKDQRCGRRVDGEGWDFEGIDFVKVPQEKVGEQLGPALRLSPEDAQQLMDSLWECGLRPLDGGATAGELKAVREHISDFRRIVFKQLKIEQ